MLLSSKILLNIHSCTIYHGTIELSKCLIIFCISVFYFVFQLKFIDNFIIDVPDRPEGPVEISNITKDSVTLSWQPPSKDGGSPLTGYVIEQRDTRRTQWVKSGSVDKDTTSFTASKLLEDSEYVFRVTAVNAEGDSTPLESSPAKPTRPKSK